MSEPISSPHNARVAAARKLLQSRSRTAGAAFLAEGPHAVDEALGSARHTVEEVFVTATAADRERDLLRRAAADDVRITVVTDRVAATMSDTVTPQGVIAVVRTRPGDVADVLTGNARLLAVLAGVSDPGNAGTVIRTADAVGADGVVLTDDTVDAYNPKCVRASAGSLFHLPVVRGGPALDVMAAMRASGVTVAATTLSRDALDLESDEVRRLLAAPLAWVFGNEAHGLSDDVAGAADVRVRIPLHGAAESLNLAAAAAICLYAAARVQRSR